MPFNKEQKKGFDALQELKLKLKERYAGVNNVQGIGIGGGKLRVYLRQDAEMLTEFEGVPIEKIITGDIRMLSDLRGSIRNPRRG